MSSIDSCLSAQQRRPIKAKKAERIPSQSQTPAPEVALPQSLPAPVAENSPGTYIVWHERLVSKPIALSDLCAQRQDELLTRYVRAAMVAFSWTPQAYIIRKMLPPAASQTFDAEYVNAADFTVTGQRIDGVYTLQYRGKGPGNVGGERVELRLDPPEEYSVPKSEGIIVVAVEPVKGSGGLVVFANETWLWRKVDEKPTLLESAVGRWFHSLLAAWLIGKGISSVRKVA